MFFLQLFLIFLIEFPYSGVLVAPIIFFLQLFLKNCVISKMSREKLSAVSFDAVFIMVVILNTIGYQY